MPGPISSVSDQFPVGLRVLLVDDDFTCLCILDRMLKSCLYQVTKCNRAEVALGLLRENKNAYDIVISDVHMPEMDGFKLLEHIVHEMDVPVIMMSADSSKNVVMKGVTYGACDFLVKPVRIEELKNIWQHVIRIKNHEQPRNVEDGDLQQMQPGKHIVWTVELHQQFVAAVNQIGIDKAVPKKIQVLMNVPGLTREEVASHLQKYRLYLRKISQLPHQYNFLMRGTPGAETSLNHPNLQPLSFSDQLSASLDTAVVSTSSPNLPEVLPLAASVHLPAHSIEISQATVVEKPTTESTTWMPKSSYLRKLFSFEGIGKQKGGYLPVWIATVRASQPRTVAFNLSNFLKALAIIFSILFLIFHFFLSSM